MSAAAAPVSVTETLREIHVEDLVGRPLCDSDGRKVGRIQELVAELEGTDWVVVEAHVGPGALLERVMDLSALIPFFGLVERRLRKRYRVPWNELDVSNPDHPRALVRLTDLSRLEPNG